VTRPEAPRPWAELVCQALGTRILNDVSCIEPQKKINSLAERSQTAFPAEWAAAATCPKLRQSRRLYIPALR
jgi:hypothetical protein